MAGPRDRAGRSDDVADRTLDAPQRDDQRRATEPKEETERVEPSFGGDDLWAAGEGRSVLEDESANDQPPENPEE
jgi:hypothetical protein